MDIASRLKTMMRKNGVTSAKRLAELSGVSQTMISRILRGEAAPTTATLEILCNGMGITLEDFFASDSKQNDDEIWRLREELRRRPGMRTLFMASKNATEEDLMRAVRIIEALKKESGYDDDE